MSDYLSGIMSDYLSGIMSDYLSGILWYPFCCTLALYF